jgi:hypothetical protein
LVRIWKQALWRNLRHHLEICPGPDWNRSPSEQNLEVTSWPNTLSSIMTLFRGTVTNDFTTQYYFFDMENSFWPY